MQRGLALFFSLSSVSGLTPWDFVIFHPRFIVSGGVAGTFVLSECPIENLSE